MRRLVSVPVFTRRQIMVAAGAGVLLATESQAPQLAVEAYIFQQYALRQKKQLKDVIGEVLPMARDAGFRNIELNQEFLSPDLRDRVLSLVRSNGLSMPSVYVGGPMHQPPLAEETIKRVLEIAGICQPFGCNAVVHNPDPKPYGDRKGDEELSSEAQALNRMGWLLQRKGFQLRVHNHAIEMLENAREWLYILHNTDAAYVALCMDLDWIHQGDQDPLALLHEAGARVAEIHVRNSQNKLWLESVEYGDIDYRKVAAYLWESHLSPLIVVELAYRENTVVRHTLPEDLRSSRLYTERIFGIT